MQRTYPVYNSHVEAGGIRKHRQNAFALLHALRGLLQADDGRSRGREPSHAFLVIIVLQLLQPMTTSDNLHRIVAGIALLIESAAEVDLPAWPKVRIEDEIFHRKCPHSPTTLPYIFFIYSAHKA